MNITVTIDTSPSHLSLFHSHEHSFAEFVSHTCPTITLRHRFATLFLKRRYDNLLIFSTKTLDRSGSVTVDAETRSARTRFPRTGPTSPSPTPVPPRPSRSQGFAWETRPSAWCPRRSPSPRRCWPYAGATPRYHQPCSRQQRCRYSCFSSNDVVSFGRLWRPASWGPCRRPARRGGWPRRGSSNTQRRTQPRLHRPPRRRPASGDCVPAAEGRWLGGPLETKLFEKKINACDCDYCFQRFGWFCFLCLNLWEKGKKERVEELEKRIIGERIGGIWRDSDK